MHTVRWGDLPAASSPQAPQLRIGTPDWPQYARAFGAVQTALATGQTYVLNLCTRTPIECNQNLDQIASRIEGTRLFWWRNRLLCFSPEPFVQIDPDGRICTHPMKGTSAQGDRTSLRILMQSPKERSEHAMIVDLLRNDLGRIGSDIRVSAWRRPSRIRTRQGTDIWQTSSRIEGRLGTDWRRRLGDILFELLPAGSVSGMPKKRAAELIHSIESAPRHWYTGIFGIFTGSRLDTAVAIRFLEQSAHQLYYRSGGGITSESRMEDEYAECIRKIYIPTRC